MTSTRCSPPPQSRGHAAYLRNSRRHQHLLNWLPFFWTSVWHHASNRQAITRTFLLASFDILLSWPTDERRLGTCIRGNRIYLSRCWLHAAFYSDILSKMPMCSFCQTIPFRAIAEVIRSREEQLILWTVDTEQSEGVEASESAKWQRLTSCSYRQWHHIRHNTLPVVTESAAKCELCAVILNATQYMSIPADTEQIRKLAPGEPDRHPGHHIWLCIPGTSLDLNLGVYYGDQLGPDIYGDSRFFLVRTSLGTCMVLET